MIRRRFAAGLKNFEQLHMLRLDARVRYHNNPGDEPIEIDWSEKS